MRAREFTEPGAAGCIIVAEDTGRWCLQQRSDSVSDPGVWSTWGGGREPGETLEQTVRRELAEEGGYVGPLKLEPLHSTGQYATFVGRVPREFEPKLNRESKDWCWVEADQLPEPMHPGLVEALSKLNEDVSSNNEKLSYIGNCTQDDVVDDIFGNVSEFARMVELHGDEFSVDDLVVKYDDDKDIHHFYYRLSENFADGKVRGKSRPGRVKRAGASCAGSVTDLRARAKKYGGERGKMYHWCANMKSGRKK